MRRDPKGFVPLFQSSTENHRSRQVEADSIRPVPSGAEVGNLTLRLCTAFGKVVRQLIAVPVQPFCTVRTSVNFTWCDKVCSAATKCQVLGYLPPRGCILEVLQSLSCGTRAAVSTSVLRLAVVRGRSVSSTAHGSACGCLAAPRKWAVTRCNCMTILHPTPPTPINTSTTLAPKD